MIAIHQAPSLRNALLLVTKGPARRLSVGQRCRHSWLRNTKESLEKYVYEHIRISKLCLIRFFISVFKELMLIANGMENEALLQRQRVKELEDYLDNLLLRVMETHPKILQNPYSRTTSAKR